MAAVVYAIDQVSKYLITENLELGELVPVIGQALQLHFVKNSGAAFSLATGFTWILTIVAVAVIGFIVIFAPRIRSLGWATMFGLVLGGALGNFTDRLFREPSFGQGHVVDFIQVWGFPAIFNVADIAVVSSMGLFILLSLRGTGLDGKRAAKTPSAPEAEPPPAKKA